MAIQEYAFENAPSWAKNTSTFARDERCEEVDCIVGDSHDEVYSATRMAFINLELANRKKVCDYDINWSREGEMWVGVTAIDV